MDLAVPPSSPRGRAPGRALALFVLLLGAITIATTPILFRLSLTGPAAAGFWRLIFALPLLAPMLARRGRRTLAPSPILLLAGVMFAGDLACWHYAIRFTTVALATVLSNLAPVLVTLGGWLLWRERPTGRFLIGMVAAMAGAMLMALARPGGGPPALSPALGDGLGAATAVWYGLYFLCVRRARADHDATAVMLWTSLVGAPILLALAVVLREPLTPPIAAGWAALAGLGVAHAAGQGAIAWSLGRLPAATAAVVVLVQPVAAAVLAFAVFSEAVSLPQALAGAAALAGVAFATVWSQRAPPIADGLPRGDGALRRG